MVGRLIPERKLVPQDTPGMIQPPDTSVPFCLRKLGMEPRLVETLTVVRLPEYVGTVGGVSPSSIGIVGSPNDSVLVDESLCRLIVKIGLLRAGRIAAMKEDAPPIIGVPVSKLQILRLSNSD